MRYPPTRPAQRKKNIRRLAHRTPVVPANLSRHLLGNDSYTAPGAAHRATLIVAALTQRVDILIQALYAEATEEHGEPTGFAVIAQGGYGRGALNPHSDIDLLFLFQKKVREGDPITRAILHTLWDLRFDVGYGTRTLSDCITAAQDDTDSMTAMLETRHLVGDPTLRDQTARRPCAAVFWSGARAVLWKKNIRNASSDTADPNFRSNSSNPMSKKARGDCEIFTQRAGF